MSRLSHYQCDECEAKTAVSCESHPYDWKYITVYETRGKAVHYDACSKECFWEIMRRVSEGAISVYVHKEKGGT